MTRTISDPRVVSLDDVQHVVIEDASWELYEKLLCDIDDRPIRVTYDNGWMEIMSPLPKHEGPKKIIGGMIEMLCFELRALPGTEDQGLGTAWEKGRWRRP